MRPLEVGSLGAGVQSTTYTLMSLHGDLPPLDAVVFADTRQEPANVYRHLWWLAGKCAEAGVPVYVVCYGDLGERALDLDKRSGTIPVFIRNADGSQGIVRRQCTADFKVAVIDKQLKALRKAHDGADVRQWLGISLDEVHRMKPSRQPWVTNVYPLIERRMTRLDCENWMAARGYSAPRSACSFCPYHSDNEWRRLRDEEPAEFDRAVRFERELQAAHATDHPKAWRGVPFLHRSMVPLDAVDLTTPEDHGQMSMFGNECAGVCGV